MECFTTTEEAINQYTSLFLKNSNFTYEPISNKPAITSVNIQTSEGGSLQRHRSPMTIDFSLHTPSADWKNLALSFQIFNNRDQAVIFKWLFDKEQPFGRTRGVQKIQFSFPDLRLYKGTYFIRVHLADSRTREKLQQFDCCNFQVEMLEIPEPEWGWNDGVCQYVDDGNWTIS